MDLAFGIIIKAASIGIIKPMVSNLINPVIGLFLGV
jgi:large-conductance mechanosensitive channel